MASKELVAEEPQLARAIEKALIEGNLDSLTSEQKLSYYNAVCESIGLNPLTNPFQYLRLNGKVVLYATKSCTDQLRQIHGVSVLEMVESQVQDVFVVTVKVQNAKGRIDQSKGAVTLGNLRGDALANAIMKCETKAKRRATLSICGLGMLDETEIETIPGAAPVSTPLNRDEIVNKRLEELAKPVEPPAAEQTVEGAWREKIKSCSTPEEFNAAMGATKGLPNDFKTRGRAILLDKAEAAGFAWNKSKGFCDPKAYQKQLEVSVADFPAHQPEEKASSGPELIEKNQEIEIFNMRKKAKLSIVDWTEIKGQFGLGPEHHTRDFQKDDFQPLLQVLRDRIAKAQ